MDNTGYLSRKPVAVLFLIALAFLPYINSLSNPFIWDDVQLILENPGIQGGFGSIVRAFSPTMWGLRADEEAFQSFYRPLHTILSIIDYNIWGLNPFGYHLSNTILHLISTVLIFFFGVKAGFDDTVSFLSSAVFALHPVHTESVSFISARVDLLSSIFLLSSFLLYFESRAGGGSGEVGVGAGVKGVLLYVASLFSLLLALLSKEMALTMPFLLSAYAVIIEEKGGRLKRVLPYYAVVVLYFVFRVFAMSTFVKLHEARADLTTLLLTASAVFFDYIRLLVVPYPLRAYYTTVWHGFDLKVAASFGLLGCSLALTAWLVETGRKRGAFALVWTYVALIPVMNIGALGEFSMAERYLYIPSIGYSLALSSFIVFFMRINRTTLRVFQALTAALLIVFAFLTIQRNKVWADDVVFYRNMAEGAPDSALPHANLAHALDRKGRTLEAIEEMKEAIQYARNNHILYNSLGSMYMREKSFGEAAEAFETAVRLKPDYVTALNNLGISYAEAGDLERASLAFAKVLEIDPANRAARENMVKIEGMRGMKGKAKRQIPRPR